MKISQRLTALILGAALLLSTGFAATLEERFPALQEFPGYSDVSDDPNSKDAWFYPSAKALYEMKIMVGDGHGHFTPDQKLTVAECAVVAAAIHSRGHGGEGVPQTTPWYAGHMTYLTNVAKEQNNWSAVTLLGQADPVNTPITRYGFFLLLSLAADDDMLQPVRSITSLPDTTDPTVLRFYNAGILSGKDKYGTFDGDAYLPRNECARMTALLVRPQLRSSAPLADYSPFRAARLTPATLLFPGVTAERYLTEVNDLIASLEQVCRNNNMEFNWFNKYGDQTFLEYVKSQSLTQLGVDVKTATQAYKDLDLQEYYARLIALTENPQ